MATFVSRILNPSLVTVPYICLRGAVSRQMTIYVNNMLDKVPSKAKTLAIVVNSNQGSFAQAHIINKKINQFAKKKNIQVITFIQEFATNAGFMIGINGNRVFADRTSVLGGLEVNISKLKLGDMIKHVTYSLQPSVGSQLNHTQQMNPQKKKEMERIYQQFSQDSQKQIRQIRKISSQIDLSAFLTAQQAKKSGLIDQFGRIFQVIPKQNSKSQLKQLVQSPFQKIKTDLRKINFW